MSRCYSSAFAGFLCFFLSTICFTPLCAWAAVTRTSSSGTEVAYLLAGSTVLTYDVDRATGNPTEEGSGVTLDSATNTVLLPSANDHFLYVTGYDSSLVEHLWVYATDATGVPQMPAVQTLNLTDGSFYTYDFVINPDGTLAFAAEGTQSPQGYTVIKISSFTIDPTTGIVTKIAKPVTTYKPNGPCLTTAEAFFTIYGFNPTGTVMYDFWDCNYPFANNSANYYSRTVDQTTGAIGPDRQIFSWADGNFGQDVVNITPSSIVYFSIPNNTSYGDNSLNFYSLSGKPVFSCAAAMLEACGYGLWNYLDPTGKFDLVETAPDQVEITKVELGQKKLVDTNNYVQGIFQGFAPDEALIYTEQANQSNPWLYPIYVFNPNTGAVTYTGGEIWDTSGVATLIPALRE